MTSEELKLRIPESELIFLTSRSSGPGGQNVNKVNTKVEIRFSIKFSGSLSDAEKEIIYLKLRTRINNSGELIVKSQSERSQLRNKQRALDKMFELLSGALTDKPLRRSTLPSYKSKQERLDSKRKRSGIKKLRKEDYGPSDDF